MRALTILPVVLGLVCATGALASDTRDPAPHRGTTYYILTMVAEPGGFVQPDTGPLPAGSRMWIDAHAYTDYVFAGWTGTGPGSYTGPAREVRIQINGPITQVAHFRYTGDYPLTMIHGPGGTVTPGSGQFPAGSAVNISVDAHIPYEFVEWIGTGPGSYSGTSLTATITMDGPITQEAVFRPDGFGTGNDFSISASATDPYVNAGAPTDSLRYLYLWMTCTDRGLSAFEAAVTGTLPVFEFTPLNGVLNADPNGGLMLAVPGCPQGPDVNFLLGYWTVLDQGGQLCLGPSEVRGVLAAVDCEDFFEWPPFVRGFSSGAVAPCRIGTQACGADSIGPLALTLSQLRATPTSRGVEVSWVTSAEVDHDGFHVYRGTLPGGEYLRISEKLVRGRSPYRFVDTRVAGDRVYYYEVGAVDLGGAEVRYGPVRVETPGRPPLVTTPNPFRSRTELRFSLGRPGRARLAVYDVTGRVVRTVLDGERPAGNHILVWDGHDDRGRPVAGGTYFVRLHSDGTTHTRKIAYLGGR